MVKFNQLKIDAENKNLIIEVSVDDSSYYERFYIKSIKVDTQKTFIEGGPSEKAKPIYTDTGSELKTVLMEVPIVSTLEASDKDLFFVYVIIDGPMEDLADAPCEYSILTTVGVAYNKQYLYNEALSNLKAFNNNCHNNLALIDHILYHKYFELSLKGGQFMNAIALWADLTKTSSSVSLNCGCNGNS